MSQQKTSKNNFDVIRSVGLLKPAGRMGAVPTDTSQTFTVAAGVSAVSLLSVDGACRIEVSYDGTTPVAVAGASPTTYLPANMPMDFLVQSGMKIAVVKATGSTATLFEITQVE